jgi:crossover junction endodeoxyribonuclease RuvC
VTRRPLRVLGVDPGLTRCGLGVVAGPSASPSVVHQECVRTSPDTPLEQRLLALSEAIEEAVACHRPDAVAVERVLFSANVRTAMATGQAAGVALLAAARAGAPVHAYSPNEVKLTVAGDGGADKDAVGRLVAAQLRLRAVPRPADVADALAVALTHLARDRVAGLARETGAGTALAAAQREAAAAARGGWAAVLARRGHPAPSGPPTPEGRSATDGRPGGRR